MAIERKGKYFSAKKYNKNKMKNKFRKSPKCDKHNYLYVLYKYMAL